MLKKISSLLLALLMLASVCSIGFSAFATDTDTPIDGEIPEEYAVIATAAYSISISGLKAICMGSLTAKTSSSLTVKLELQKKSSGTYSTVKTWTSSKTGTSVSLEGSKVINPLSSYRLKATFTAGSETVTYYDYP